MKNYNTNKRVMIFLVWYGMGGSTLYISQYVSYLVSEGYEVIVICRKKDKGSEYLSTLGARIVFSHFPFALNFTALDEFNNGIKKNIIDIIKFFGGFFISLYLLLIYNPGKVIVGEFNEIPVLISSILLRKKIYCLFQTSISSNKYKRLILLKLLEKVDYSIGITDLHLVDLPHKNYLITIPNTVINKSNVGIESLFDDLNITADKVILFVGGITKTKGTLHFVEVALELLNLQSNLCFVILGPFNKRLHTKYAQGNDDGDFDYNNAVFQKIGKLMDIKFRLLGEIDYAQEVLKNSFLLINTNIYPHFSRPIIEAWANKVPVASYSDIYTEYMAHSRESIMFLEHGQYYKSAKIIDELIENNMLIEKLKNNGYLNFKEYYSPEIVHTAMKKLF